MTVRLEYWDKSLTNPRWVEARIEYGTSNYQNACISVEMAESLGNSRRATVRLANQNWQGNTAATGPFTNLFTDFQRVRILDDSLNIVLFHGRIYDNKDKNDKQFGKLIELTCWDIFRELQDYPTGHLDGNIVYGSGTGEFTTAAGLIKHVLKADYVHPSSLEIPSSSIYLDDSGGATNADDGTKFRTSGITLHGGMWETYNLAKGAAKNALGHIAAIARDDPHTNAQNEDDFGYDYHLDSRFDRSDDYTTSTNAVLRGDAFNYFKRGTVPAAPDIASPTSFDGLRIEYPTATFNEQGNLVAMMEDAQFERPKDQLYTSALLKINLDLRVSKTYDVSESDYNYAEFGQYMDEDNNNKSSPKAIAVGIHNGKFLVEALSGGTIGGSSGQFKYEGRRFHRDFDTAGNEHMIAENLLIDHVHSATNSDHYDQNHGDGSSYHEHIVGRIQYQSTVAATTGSILMSFDDETQLQAFNRECDIVTSAIILRTNQSTPVATYTFTPSLHRLKTKFDLQRPYKVEVSATGQLDQVRQEMAAALTKSTVEQITGRIRTFRGPYYYVDLEASAATANTLTISRVNTTISGATNNPVSHGIKRGMTIAALDSQDKQVAWGWVTDFSSDDSSISSNVTITAPIRSATAANPNAAIPNYGQTYWNTLDDGSAWTGNSNKIRVYVPVRPGHYIHVKNDSHNIGGYHFVDEVNYTELQGAIGTTYKTYGTNNTTAAYEGPYKHRLPQVLVEVDDVARRIGSLADIPAGLLPWMFMQTADGAGNETGKFTIKGRRDIEWTSGIMTLGSMYSFKIKSGSVTLDISATNQADTKPIEYIISFNPDQAPDSNNEYQFEFTKRSDYIDDIDKVRMGWARAGASTSDPAILEFSGSTTIGDLSMRSIGSALMHRGAQGFTSDMKITDNNDGDFRTCAWQAFTIDFNDGTDLNVTGSSTTLGASTNSRLSYWMYVTLPEDFDSGNGTLNFSSTPAGAQGDAKLSVGMAIVEVDDTDSDEFNMPSIFPINAKDPVISAGLIDANHISSITASLGTITSGTIKLALNDYYGAALTKVTGGGSYTETHDLRALFDSGNGIYMEPQGIYGIGNNPINLDGLTNKYTAEWMTGSGSANAGNNQPYNRGYIMAGAYPPTGNRTPTIKIGAQGIQLGSFAEAGATSADSSGSNQEDSFGTKHFAYGPYHPSIGVIGIGGGNDQAMRPPELLGLQMTYSYATKSGNFNKYGILRFNNGMDGTGLTAHGGNTGFWGDGIAWSSFAPNDNSTEADVRVARAGITYQPTTQGKYASSGSHYASSSGGAPARGRLEFTSFGERLDGTHNENTQTDFYVGDNGNNGSTSPIWQFAIPTDYTDKALTRIGSLSFSNSVSSNQVTIEGPPSNPTTYTVILPAGAPTASGQTLQTTGSTPFSQLEWGASGGVTTSTFNAHVGNAAAHHTATANTWRDIDDTPANGVTTESISSNWAYDHENDNSLHGGGGGGGSGTVNSGAANRGAYYASAGTTLDDTNYYMSQAQVGSTATRVTTVASQRLYTSSSIVEMENLGTTWGGYYASFDANGRITSYNSSQRFKENIENLAVDTSKIFDLTARQFKYKDTTEVIHTDEEDPEEEETVTITGRNDIGYIAEEVYDHVPSLVTLNKAGQPDAVNYAMVAVLLLEEVKKLKTRIEALEAG